MARDRKRAKQRRERQARAGGQPRRTDAATAQPPGRDRDGQDENALEQLHEQEPPELASGDADLAEAHLALGRPELAGEGDAAGASGPDVVDDPAELPELASEQQFEALEDEVDETEADFEGRGEEAGEGVPAGRRARARREARGEGNRFANFVRGSWRELQRVQWPDRRQVAQATAVVVGFVIVAGAFLGLADLVAGKIVDFII